MKNYCSPTIGVEAISKLKERRYCLNYGKYLRSANELRFTCTQITS